MTDPDELLTSHVTAALIGIKNNTLEIWRGQSKGPPFIKLGDAPQAPVRYRRGDVIAFIEQRLYASTSHYTVVSRMWWKLPSSGLRACNDGSSQAARSRDIGSSG